jgi:hypothetical protein
MKFVGAGAYRTGTMNVATFYIDRSIPAGA